MAYVASGLQLLMGGLSNTDNNMWVLNTTDAIADVNTSNYVSDGVTRGMKQGDTVLVKIRSSLPLGGVTGQHWCWVINSATGTDALGVDLTDGLAITATDTD